MAILRLLRPLFKLKMSSICYPLYLTGTELTTVYRRALILVGLLLALISSTQAQTIRQPASAKDEPELSLTADDEVRYRIANDVAINLVEGKYNLVTNSFDANLKTTFKEDMVRGVWYQYSSTRGGFVRIEAITPGTEVGLKSMNVICRFDNGYVYILALFKEKEVTALFVR